MDDRKGSVKRAAVIDALAALDKAHSMLGNRGSSAQEEEQSQHHLRRQRQMSKSGEANIPAAAFKEMGKGKHSSSTTNNRKEGREKSNKQVAKDKSSSSSSNNSTNQMQPL